MEHSFLDKIIKRFSKKAKAQETDADMRLYADTRFRQAELLFAQGRYPEAGDAYRSVVELGESVPAYEQSLYKLGWSRFRQEAYEPALERTVMRTFNPFST